MWIFQAPYNFFKNWTAPLWLKKILQELNDLMIAILMQLSKAYIEYLQGLIIEAAQNTSWSAKERFDYVFKNAKKGFVEFTITLKDSELTALINYLVLSLKKKEVI